MGLISKLQILGWQRGDFWEVLGLWSEGDKVFLFSWNGEVWHAGGAVRYLGCWLYSAHDAHWRASMGFCIGFWHYISRCLWITTYSFQPIFQRQRKTSWGAGCFVRNPLERMTANMLLNHKFLMQLDGWDSLFTLLSILWRHHGFKAFNSLPTFLYFWCLCHLKLTPIKHFCYQFALLHSFVNQFSFFRWLNFSFSGIIIYHLNTNDLVNIMYFPIVLFHLLLFPITGLKLSYFPIVLFKLSFTYKKRESLFILWR